MSCGRDGGKNQINLFLQHLPEMAVIKEDNEKHAHGGQGGDRWDVHQEAMSVTEPYNEQRNFHLAVRRKYYD